MMENTYRMNKYKEFEKMCKENYGKHVIVSNMLALGDTIEDIESNVKLATVRYGCDIYIASINAKITSYISTS